jgi:N-acetylglucosaminyldiphosphoundecaprenol N-acetyl-beta-D-mannosaminyltransferase
VKNLFICRQGFSGLVQGMATNQDNKASETRNACLQGGAAERFNVLGTYFNLSLSYEDVMATIQDWRESRGHHYVTLTPPHSVVLGQRDRHLQQATNDASLVLPDGVGIILAARLFGYPHRGRVSGPTLMLRVCDTGRDWGARHFLYGGWPGFTDVLVAKLTAQFPGMIVAGAYCPPFREMSAQEDAELLRHVNDCHPDIVWVGTGSPKQEKWMAQHVGRIQAPVLIGVGAAFDFHSGRMPWAPKWMREMGIEWMFRLATEPKRLWPRSINSLTFLVRVLYEALRHADSRQTIVTQGSGSTRLAGRDVAMIPYEQAVCPDKCGQPDAFTAGLADSRGSQVPDVPCDMPAREIPDGATPLRAAESTRVPILDTTVHRERQTTDRPPPVDVPSTSDSSESRGADHGGHSH